MTRTERRRRAVAAAIPKESTGCAPSDPHTARNYNAVIRGSEPLPYMGGPGAATNSPGPGRPGRVDMTDTNESTCQATESCTDRECQRHRFDLYAALIGVADAWMDSLPMSDPTTTRRAFIAVAELAASEVLP